MDLGEKKKETALREVEEETGVKNLKLGSKICVTKHTYRNKKGSRLIKKNVLVRNVCGAAGSYAPDRRRY